jgi:hypothetical protein
MVQGTYVGAGGSTPMGTVRNSQVPPTRKFPTRQAKPYYLPTASRVFQIFNESNTVRISHVYTSTGVFWQRVVSFGNGWCLLATGGVFWQPDNSHILKAARLSFPLQQFLAS